jgi:hypothetical protein
MQELRNDNDVLMWKDFSKEDVGEDKFIEEVKRFFEEYEEMKDFREEYPRVRMLIQNDNPKGKSSTNINMDIKIEDWQIKEYKENIFLIINRHNLNYGTRIDLDITNAEIANITFDREDGYKCLQIDGTGIWIDIN